MYSRFARARAGMGDGATGVAGRGSSEPGGSGPAAMRKPSPVTLGPSTNQTGRSG
jgi:hypothetical protein